MSLLLAALLVAPLPLAPPVQSGRQRFRCGRISEIPGRLSPRVLEATPLAPVSPRAATSSAGSTPADWRVWWTYNQDTYLRLYEHRLGTEREVATDFFDEESAELPALDPDRERAVIARTLLAALEDRPTPVLAGAALLSLGRLAPSGASGEAARDRMLVAAGDSNRTLAETATLSLGLLGGHAAARDLAALVEDTERGRALAGRRRVPDRQRAMAAYALALAAREADRDLVRFAVHHLHRTLEDASSATDDLEVACALALAILEHEGPGAEELEEGTELPPSASRTVLARRLLEQLDRRGTSRALRAQLPTVLARLAERADRDTREAVVTRLVELVAPCAGEPEAVVQGAVVALGELGDADDDELDALVRSALEGVRESASATTRGLAAVSLARTAARPGLGEGSSREAIADELLAAVERGPYSDRPWNALASGVLARELEDERLRSGRSSESTDAVPSRTERDLLPTELVDERSPDLAGALALASGLTRAPRAAELLARKLEETRDDGLRGELAIAMGLTGDRRAIPVLQGLLSEAEHRPVLLLRTVSALAMLGDETRVPRLLELTRRCDCLLGETAIYQALGLAGDRHAVATLVSAVGDSDRPDDVRAVAATALGRLADSEELPFSQWFARDLVVEGAPRTLSAEDGTGIADLR